MVAADGGVVLNKARRLRTETTMRHVPAATRGRSASASAEDWYPGIAAVGAPLAKAKRRPESPLRPASGAAARSEILDKSARARFEEEIDAALKRRPANEARLAG